MHVPRRPAMIRPALALGLVALLGACALPPGPPAAPPQWDEVVRAAGRGHARAHLEMPFARGPLDVVARENGFLHSYRLGPCQGGASVCAGGGQGRAGTLEVGADYHVVRGLFGRVFWLAPGGGGAMAPARGGAFVPIAWGPVDDPLGPWETARLTEPGSAP
ncbi:MAG: hypothetical protein IT542_03110 [Rubellimicrobium sp.]|nr:hypothetical protein [Rubellimicrobium sp.]